MTPQEQTQTAGWLRAVLAGAPPFSFEYDGIPSAELLTKWPTRYSTAINADGTIQHMIIYADPATSLECELALTEYPESPAVEWLAHFRNKGTTNTPILANIQALDIVQPSAAGSSVTLYSSKGTLGAVDDFILQRRDLPLNSEIKMLELNDGSSRINLPFFNLAIDHAGVIVGIGWTGNWACSFQRRERGDVNIRTGLARTHLTLHPGEEIRTPPDAAPLLAGRPDE